ncbi:MAG: hypothetical protein AAGK60_13030 [Pseudomonadota bacterium]
MKLNFTDPRLHAAVLVAFATACTTTGESAQSVQASANAVEANSADLSETPATDAAEDATDEKSVKTASADGVNEEDENRIICKRQRVTGSRFTKKICRTWAEWKQSAESGREFAEQSSRRGGLIAPGSN